MILEHKLEKPQQRVEAFLFNDVLAIIPILIFTIFAVHIAKK
jgi:hypothetical protein